MNRRPIFQAIKALLRAREVSDGFTSSEVRAIDAGIDEAIASVQPVGPPPTPPPAALPSPIGMISVDLLRTVAPGVLGLDEWIEPLRATCLKCEINTIRRVASFLANIAVESGFKPRQENLNYSMQGLAKTFGRHRISLADCKRYGRGVKAANQEAIANCIYGGEWGRINLGNTEPGDGWKFRGVGPMQITGRANMQKFADFMGMTLEAALAYARTLGGGIMAAGWFWESHDINRLADTPGIKDEVHRINGGENGLAAREAAFNTLIAAMLRMEKSA